jgi:ABC-type sugar transport system substrate-binding protein
LTGFETIMMHRQRSRHLVALTLLGLWILGCSQGEAPSGATASPSAGKSSGRPLKVGMMPKLMSIEYFNQVGKGAKEAAQELGIDLTYDGPPDNKVELQTQMIDEWIALGFDVIAVAANDPEVISPALKRAKDAGIVTLTWDADANPQSSGRLTFVNQAPFEAVGNLLVDIMAECIGGEGKTVIVTGSATGTNQNEWMKVMDARLKAKYPKITRLETLVPEEDQNRARQLTLDTLNAHPDLKGIWGITSVALPGAAEAVRQAGKTGKVCVTGLSLPNTIRSYVKDGTITKVVLWNPIDHGYLAVHVAKALAEKSLKPGEQSFGHLKGVRVLDGEVIQGPPFVFDQNNIDQFDF